MLVFGTQIHIVTFVFILLEAGMLLFQFFYYLLRPEDKSRLLYLILLVLLLFYNITGGLFPDPKIHIPIATQKMIAYGSGFLMASYFPYYFYKGLDLKPLRWHALFGVPLFLMLPYVIFFVVVYSIYGNLNVSLKYGMIVPFIYALVLLWVMFKTIREKNKIDRNNNQFVEEIAMYLAVSPWASLTVFGIVEESQLFEVLCTNTGIIAITFLFIWKSIRKARSEYQRLLKLSMEGTKPEVFHENCQRYRLTKTEVEIIQLLIKGKTNKEIAESLFVSEETIKNTFITPFAKHGLKTVKRYCISFKLSNSACF